MTGTMEFSANTALNGGMYGSTKTRKQVCSITLDRSQELADLEQNQQNGTCTGLLFSRQRKLSKTCFATAQGPVGDLSPY